MREIDDYTSPLDEAVEESDFAFELPGSEAGLVLIVDDEESSALLHHSILEAAGYRVRTFGRGSDVLEHLVSAEPIVLVTDYDMPEMSGIELAEHALDVDPDIKIILLTGRGDETTAQTALRLGFSDYIIKPPEPIALARAVQRAFHQRAGERHHRAMLTWMKMELGRRQNEIRDVTLSTLAAFANALDTRSPHFHGHSRAVALQAGSIAVGLGLSEDEVESVRIAGLLHDVGMIAVPDYIVEKSGALTEEEFAIIKTHCDRGVEILEPMEHLGDSIRFIHEHHERLDGSGYPMAKRGDEISLGGQIVGIAEAWVAILESRPYRSGVPRVEGLEMLLKLAGEWFLPEVTQALVDSDVGML
ncbi:MAG: HD-GYP domain-containing protein [Longimicrobiales bacterium]